MSSGVLHRLTEKKGKQLSKFLGIDSVPSTRLIATMQSRINNPLFKLSMTDYEAMCGNKMMVRIMSKVIGCEEKQLKKFCKYINVFAENIESSPKSIKNKMKATNSINASKRKGSLSVLPDDILEKIVNKYKTIFKIKYKLKDWIPLEKLDWAWLSANPNAIELLKANPDNINWKMLLENTNPRAIELLKENQDRIDIQSMLSWMITWGSLSRNPAAIELLKENPKKINWELLSSNPAAIDMLKAHPNDIDWRMLSSNPAAIDMLKANQNDIDWRMLSSNPAAIELLKQNKTKICWYMLSKNINPKAIDMLKTNSNNINWEFLSENPAAIELLKENKTKIFWKNLSINPAIFDEVLE
jgi:hypothetical protein